MKPASHIKELLPKHQLLHLRKALATLDRQNKGLRTLLGSRQEFAEAVAAAVVAAPPLRRSWPNYTRPGQKPSAVAVLMLSDWHVGEVISARETDGFGRFNYATAEERISNIVRDVGKWLDSMRHSYSIRELAVFGLGDYVSGDIHGELVATNEFPLPVQTARAGLLLGDVLRRLASFTPKLTAYMVGADNHGRLQKKPQAKQKTSNNMSYLVHQLAKEHLARCPNVTLEIAEGAKLLAPVGGFRFLMEHGDAVKGWAGLPYYGFGRLVGKEALRRMNTPKGFHYWVIGHFHVPGIIEGRTLVNGSLSGTSEFDHIQGRHAGPAQVAFLVHPQHGIFNWVPFSGK
jgi:hypothetical protein